MNVQSNMVIRVRVVVDSLNNIRRWCRNPKTRVGDLRINSWVEVVYQAGRIAQSVERSANNAVVLGSSPSMTNFFCSLWFCSCQYCVQFRLSQKRSFSSFFTCITYVDAGSLFIYIVVQNLFYRLLISVIITVIIIAIFIAS